MPNITVSIPHEMYLNLIAKSQVEKASISKATQYYIRLGMIREREIDSQSQ